MMAHLPRGQWVKFQAIEKWYFGYTSSCIYNHNWDIVLVLQLILHDKKINLISLFTSTTKD